MQRRRKPVNYFRWAFWVILIGLLVYVNQIADTIPAPWQPTPTPTRDPEALVSEATLLFAQGKLPQSIDSYQEALRARPNEPSLYVALARAQIYVGQYAQAQINAENALLLNSNNSMAHTMRAWALLMQNDYLNAEATIKDALDIDPNNGIAHAVYAEIIARQYFDGTAALDAVDRMSEESRTALALAPESMEAHRARGYVLYVTQNYADAIQEYLAAIAINGSVADLHLNLGLNYRAIGVNEEAVQSFSRANTLNPADPLPDLYISRTYANIGEYAKAEQYAEQAVRDAPGDAFLRGNLGVMYYRNFKWPDAEKELSLVVKGGSTEDGIQITPLELTGDSIRITEYYFVYGITLVRLKRCGEALPIASRIQERAPNDETAQFNASEIIRLCSEAAQTPQAGDTTIPDATLEATPELTPTP